jgi:hypothetical protein
MTSLYSKLFLFGLALLCSFRALAQYEIVTIVSDKVGGTRPMRTNDLHQSQITKYYGGKYDQ